MSASDGRIVGGEKVINNGPDSARWNLVIVGDGYRESELGPTYQVDVRNFINVLAATPPFNELFRGINVHRVDVASNESGADDPLTCADGTSGTGATPRTFFDATFCGGGRDRRILTVNSTLARDVATARVPLRHQVLCIVNSTKYGGSGSPVAAVCSTHSTAALIAIHEIGHSAFGLADEYGGTTPPSGDPPYPNVTRKTNRGEIPWRALINASTPVPSRCTSTCASSTCVPPSAPPPAGAVGAYEGGFYSDCNTYRPLPTCRMRDLGSQFCPVCAGVIRQTLRPFQPA